MRTLLALAVLLGGCGGRAIGASPSITDAPTVAPQDAGPAAEDSAVAAPDSAPTLGCTASNYLDRDSFDVVSAALAACLQGEPGPDCARGASSLTLTNLDQGVGTIVFDYGTSPDGTHTLLGHGTPGVTPAPPGTVFEVAGIPASVTFEAALLDFFVTTAPPPFPCALM